MNGEDVETEAGLGSNSCFVGEVTRGRGGGECDWWEWREERDKHWDPWREWRWVMRRGDLEGDRWGGGLGCGLGCCVVVGKRKYLGWVICVCVRRCVRRWMCVDLGWIWGKGEGRERRSGLFLWVAGPLGLWERGHATMEVWRADGDLIGWFGDGV